MFSAALLTVMSASPLVGPASAASAADPAAAPSGDPIGGYTAVVSSSPVSVKIFEPVIPLPAEPQGELDLSYTQVTTGTGPSNHATSSSLWPGPGLGDGFTTITQTLGLGAQDYPVKSQSAYPGGPPSSTQGAPPLATMATSADEKGASAAATVADLLPAGNALAEVGQMSSHSATTVAEDKVTGTTKSVVHELSLAGGLIHVATVTSAVTATSMAETAKSVGSLSVSGLSIGGYGFVVDEKGVHSTGSAPSLPALPLPDFPTQPADALKALGISVTGPAVVKHDAGTTASYQAHALEISIDTKPLKKMLDDLTHYQDVYGQLVGSLPDQLQQVVNNPQVPSLVQLGPKIVYTLGEVSAKATASPAYTFEMPTLPVPGPPSAPPFSASSSTTMPDSGVGLGDVGAGGVEMPADGGAAPVVSGAAPAAISMPVSAGLPAWALLAVLAGAVAVGAGLRRVAVLAGMVPGAVGCGLGAGTGVPNLREG